jgi:UDP-glucose 4-epimerase
MKKRILIIGGLGFLGKNLYNRLVSKQYSVTILAHRIAEAQDGFLTDEVRKNIVLGDILDKDFLDQNLIGYDVVFSFAGSSGASDSIKDPYKDLDTNLKGHLNILEACRKVNPQALLIFPSSRLVYGKPEVNPVDEGHPIHPESIYAIHKLTTEHYYLLYQRLYNLNCIIFRVSNPFGPYQRFGSNHYGILNWFIHKAVDKEEIEIYGDGSQKRDFIHIDDLVNLFERSMSMPNLYGKIFNVGYGKGISLKQAVDVIVSHIPGTKVIFKPWPEIDKKIETGDYISDIQLLKKEIGWQPLLSFEEGIRNTIKFYEGKSNG